MTGDGRRAALAGPDRAGFFAAHWRPIVRRLTPAVAAHLAAERVACAELLDATRYDLVVEAGCADGGLLLPTIAEHGCRYLGVDLAPEAVAEAAVALAATGAQGAVRCADIVDLPSLVADAAAAVLVAFPFNVFGNVEDPDAVLRACADTGADVAIFTYGTDQRATAERLRYYEHCGLDGPVTTDTVGVLVTSDSGFRSLVHHPPVLARLLTANGYRVHRRRYGQLGLLYHGCR